jgi:hypothetical protein
MNCKERRLEFLLLCNCANCSSTGVGNNSANRHIRTELSNILKMKPHRREEFFSLNCLTPKFIALGE